MSMRMMVVLVAAAMVAACATSPTGRSQLKLFPSGEVAQMGVAAFDEMKQEQPVMKSGATVDYVSCVAGTITSVLPAEYSGGWEISVFKDDSANAFALPGKKIGVHTGILDVAFNQHQLAAVIGHEIGHVIAGHGNERMSIQFASQTGQQLLGAVLGGSSEQRDMIMAALGAGSQYGLLLPYSRAQETEADELGLVYMAQAGFDPSESVALWQNMRKQAKEQPPEFMSTHPAPETRINALQQMMPSAEDIYRSAKSKRRQPNCRR